MKYSIEKIHEPKRLYERRNGKSVSAVADAIGKLMTTHYETVPFVIENIGWTDHLTPLFWDMCKNLYNESPVVVSINEWHIEGYTSRIKLLSMAGHLTRELRGTSVIPSVDIDYTNDLLSESQKDRWWENYQYLEFIIGRNSGFFANH